MSKAKETKQEVAQEAPKTQEVGAVAEQPTGLASNVTAQDLRLPRVALLQALSPQLQQNNALKSGMFFNTLLQEVIPSPIVFTPVFVFKNVIKYRPRSEGGGIVYKTTSFTEEVVKDCMWDGINKPTATQFINAVVLIEGQDIPLIISFSNTSFKTGQDLLTLVQLSGQAWKYNYALESQLVSNSKGSFYVMRVKRGALTNADTIIAAASLYESVKGMSIDTDFEEEHDQTKSTGAPSEF